MVAHGTPDELHASDDPEVRQFIRGEPDGPVRFHYPGRSRWRRTSDVEAAGA